MNMFNNELETLEQHTNSSGANWKLEDSEQFQLIVQGEKEHAVNVWCDALIEESKTKKYRDK